MKNIVFITQLYPWKIGRQMYSYGLIQELSEYCNLDVYSSLSCRTSLEEAKEAVSNDKIHFFQESANVFKRRISHPIQRVIFKWVTTFEPVNQEMMDAICEHLNTKPVDAVIIDHIALVHYILFLKKKYPKMVFLYNSHNAEGVNFYQFLTGKDYPKDGTTPVVFPDKKIERKFKYYSEMEKKFIKLSDYTITICKCDAELLQKIYGVSAEHFIVSHPLSKFERIKSLEDMEHFNYRLMIVGAMNWYPNVRGIIWFMEHVFAPLKSKEPKFQLYIVGRNPDSEIVKKSKKYRDIIVTGEIPSTAPYFKDCDISVIPVFEGTGAKIKVLESIARGIPTVCSGYAAKDYDIKNEISVANTAEQFINEIMKIADSCSVRKNYYQRMLEYMDDYYHPTTDMQKFLK